MSIFNGARMGNSCSPTGVKRTRLGDLMCGSSPGSSEIDAGKIGSELGPATEVISDVMSPVSLTVSFVVPVFGRRRFTTRVFFFRDRGFRPAPRARPFVAEFKLTNDGRDGSCPFSRLPESVKV